MKTRLFKYASILACVVLAASCEDGVTPKEPVDSDAKVMSFTIDATLQPTSGEGMKTAFGEKDFLRIRFANTNGEKVGRTQILRKVSGTGSSATFSADKIAVPDEANTVYAFLDNSEENMVNYGSAPTVDNLSAQKGTLEDAAAHQVISGSSSFSAGNASISMEYKTSIVKAVISYPEDVIPVANETTITLSCEQYDKVYIDLDATAESTKGDITVPATISGDKAVAYIAVWNGLKDGSIFSNIQTTKYGCDVDVKAVEAGKTFTINQAVETLVYSFAIPDEEYTVSGVRGNMKSADEWITLNGGVITVAENKTGQIRKGTIVLDNGKTYIFTQYGANEFTGKWTLYSKLFDNNKRMGGSKGDCTTDVTIALAAGENGNNITISNLYPGTSVEGKVEIDYATMKAKVGVYCSHKIYKSNFGYCVVLPECASAAAGSYWTGYNFIPKKDKEFSDTNYDWLWFDFDPETNVAKYQYHGAGQLTPNGAYKYCGLSFVIASETAITGTAYDLIHQANYNGSNAESMYFKR